VQHHHEEFRSRGARVVAIGQGTGDEAAQVCRDAGVAFECLGDPDKRVYRALGLGRASWWDVTARPFLEDPALAFRRIRHASLKGSLMRHSDVLQLPGVAIVDRAGTLRYLHRAARTDDLPATRDLLAVLDRL
jgi:hypothetical protein